MVVVGAGVAGLTAARHLAATCEVVVVDKGRGVGGRLATRRVGEATVDHGAQFITTHTAEFAATMESWVHAGVAQPWFRGRVGPDGCLDPDGHTRYRGVASMNDIAKHLAKGVDVRVATRVVGFEAVAEGWRVSLEDHTALLADGLVVTTPVPQALELLEASGIGLGAMDAAALEAISYEPCLAVLAVLEGPAGLPEPGAIDPAHGPIDWMADNYTKGVSAVSAVTLHATAAFSSKYWNERDAVIIDELVGAAGLSVRPNAGLVQVHRWRYARPTTVHPDRSLVAKDLPPLVFAGDAFGGAKVEGAARSGRAAAEALAARLDAEGGGADDVGAAQQRP